MKTSQKGIDLIKKWEGCCLTAKHYSFDPPGVITIGYGHVDNKMKIGTKITQAKAEELLKADLEKFEKNVEKYNSIYKWNQNEFDALVGFAYNIGSIDSLTSKGTRSRETIMYKWTQYVKANGKTLSGLINRRNDELRLFKQEVIASNKKTCEVIAKSGLNLRTKPSINSKVDHAVTYKTILEVKKVYDDHWLLVKHQNKELYASRKWVKEK